MVALKVQSAEDIIEACLRALGWKKDFEKAVKAVVESGISLEGDILAEIDGILLKKAAEVFGKEKCKGKEEFTALFKYCFLVCQGAEKWKEIIFQDKPLPQEFINEMIKAYPEVAPNAKPSKMKPQKIESYTVGGIIKNFFEKRKK